MVVVGLTGSIAMGKSTIGTMFASVGAPVFDADAAVKDFYAGAGARAVEAMFPGVLIDGRIDRPGLAQRVMDDRAALQRLESLVHPDVARARAKFVEDAAADRRRLVVVDIPLLLESGGEETVDVVVVASAPASIQKTRALNRTDMTKAKLDAILARQMPDSAKRRRAHFVIDTSGSFEQTRAQVAQILRAVATLQGKNNRNA